MLRAIKIRLYLDAEQALYCNRLLGSSRFVYNKCLEHRIQKYNEDKTDVGYAKMGVYLTNELKAEYPWLREVHSKVLQQSLINLDIAYKNFFRKGGVGFPRFKSKRENTQSCRFPKDAIGKIKGNRINIITPLRGIHFKCSKKDEKHLNKFQESIKSATLTKTKSNKYYLSILIESELTKSLPQPKNEIIGIDVGIKTFIADSNGNFVENIKIKRSNENKLARLHRKHSKRQMQGTGEFKYSNKWKKDVEIKKPSKNKEKARIKLAKYYEKLNNKKENYLHSVVNQLLSDNQVIVIENLNTAGMMKNHHLARSIQELSLYRFKSILKYKADWYKRDIIEVDRFFASSKLCSNCGWKNKDLKLSDRTYVCPECGLTIDRDLNAAINLKNEGTKILKIGLSSPELTPLESKS